MNGSRSTRDGIPAPLVVCGHSDTGSVRHHNEDCFGCYIPTESALWKKRGSLFAVSDGAGGSAAEDVASAEAVNVLLQEYDFGLHTENIPGRLKHAFQTAALHSYDLCASRVRS